MANLGDLFDMFSQDGENDERRQRKGQNADSTDGSRETDVKSLVINKLAKNKALLIAVVCVSILVVGAVGYYLLGYISEHGVNGIIDNVKPFIKQ